VVEILNGEMLVVVGGDFNLIIRRVEEKSS
jgi:hypothetical protein